jgi:CDP-diacylglycerol pyrophosphatase
VVRALVLVGLTVSVACAARGDRLVLFHIVDACAGPVTGDYCVRCRFPRAGTCPGIDACGATTEVWAESAEFVAIRDRKMCGCPERFVHGLALPRARVTGTEDPRRPDGIWPFAWTVATGRIAPAEVALAINPPHDRTQDQLHVHLVRLALGARDRLAARAPATAASLDAVWKVAERDAAARGLQRYGVLVAQRPEGSFAVLTSAESPEDLFTEARCR